jgi:hypothetical protein
LKGTVLEQQNEIFTGINEDTEEQRKETLCTRTSTFTLSIMYLVIFDAAAQNGEMRLKVWGWRWR